MPGNGCEGMCGYRRGDVTDVHVLHLPWGPHLSCVMGGGFVVILVWFGDTPPDEEGVSTLDIAQRYVIMGPGRCL